MSTKIAKQTKASRKTLPRSKTATRTTPEKSDFTVRGVRKSKVRASRLSVADWVNEAIKILVTRSIEHVRVESIASNLGATKGSFYWHFKDRAALLDAVIDEWQKRATTQVEAMISSETTDAKEQIRKILDFRGGSTSWGDLELAMRAWARRSARVRNAGRAIDKHRVQYLLERITSLGFKGEDALARALLIYGASRTSGAGMLFTKNMASLYDHVLTLALKR